MDEHVNDLTIEELQALLAKKLAEKEATEQKERLKEVIDKRHEEALALENERNKPSRLFNFKVHSSRVYFEHEANSILLDWLRHFPTRTFSSGFNSIEIKYWDTFKSTIPNNTTLDITPEALQSIETWTPPPQWIVDHDEKSFHVKAGEQCNIYKVSEWPEVRYYSSKMYYDVPLHLGWRLLATIVDDRVEWKGNSKEICEKQIEHRATLDNIANDTSDLVINLNGYELKEFQKLGVKYGIATGGKTLIGDEMGLGKSPQAIALAEYFRKNEDIKRILIVCPAALKINWAREIAKFTGQQAYVFSGSQPDKFQFAAWLKNEKTYYIINYDILGERTIEPHAELINQTVDKYYWVEMLNVTPPDMIIADEIHKAKSVEAHRSKALRKLDATHKVGLSGTLMINRPRELWVPLTWLDPLAAGQYETFVNRYEDNYSRKPRNVPELRELLKTYLIRRTKADVIKELDPINRITQEVELSKEARAKYDKVLLGLWEGLDRWDGNPANQQVVANILAQMIRLKQVCAQDKVDYIADLATEVYDSNTTNWKKVIIFSQFVNEPSVVIDIARRLGDEAVWFSGETPLHERQALVDKFQTDNKVHFLVASTLAASEGLNITAAGSVIFADLMWTPASHQQAEGRAYGRLSDLHSIDSYYVITANSIEETIMSILESKLAAFKEIIDGVEATRSASIAMEVISKLKGMR